MKKLFILIPLLILLTFSCSQKEQPIPETIETAVEKDSLNIYGFFSDSLNEVHGRIRKHETLSDILVPYNISYPQLDTAIKKSKDLINLRKINYNKDYIIYTEKDSLETARYFIYLPDLVNYLIVEFADSVIVTGGKREIKTKERIVSGTIEYSLYQTMVDNDVDINLAIRLSELYAWQIDFWSVRKGDSFTVLFEEKFVDTLYTGIGKIKGAVFNHRDTPYYAFLFDQGEGDDYFDENGQSLRKAFLKAPLKFSRISSHYSGSRFHPILKYYRPHRGIDFAAPKGTPVHSVGDGVVVERRRKGGAGNWVKIKHNGTYSSGYMHLWKYAKGLNVGDKVKQGDLIGYVGSTGLSTGPHLDFRFYINGQPVNYLKQEFPASHPVEDDYKDQYFALKDSLMTLILPEKIIAASTKADSVGSE